MGGLRLKTFFVILTAILIAAVYLAGSNNVEGITLTVSVLLGVLSLRFSVIVPAFFIVSTLIVRNEILPALAGTQEIYGFGFIKIHPASLVVFIGSFLGVVTRRKSLLGSVKRSKVLSAIIIIFAATIASMLLQTFALRGLKGIPQCVENYLFPFCFFLYLLTLEDRHLMSILKSFVIFIVAIASYGIFEYFYSRNPLYDNLYLRSGFDLKLFKYINEYRITTSIGHPLKNALYFLFALPVSAFFFKKPFNLICASILTIAVFLTGSRIATLIAIASIALYFTNLTFDFRKHIKSVLIIILLLVAVFFCIFYTPIGNTIMRRFVQDNESIAMRMRVIDRAGQIVRENLILGEGVGTSFDRSVFLFNKSVSFENPWLMLVNDVGFLTGILYFSIFIILILCNIKKIASIGASKAIIISFLSVVIMLSSFSSFGIRNTINLLVWLNISLLFRDFDSKSLLKSREL